jgi:putative spermidine/putrescine transport system permease protein
MASLLGRALDNPYFLLAPSAFFILTLLLSDLILLRYSFNAFDPVRRMVPAWTLQNYGLFFSDPYYVGEMLNTLRITLIVTLACLLLGYPVAYLMSISKHRNLLLFATVAPLLVDVLVRTFGWIVLLSNRGLINSLLISVGIWTQPQRLLFTEGSVIAELIHEHLAFMVLPLAAVLLKLDPRLREAAAGLGAGGLTIFIRITLPLSIPGIIAGSLLTFATTVSAFVAPLILGGGKVVMMSVIIRDQMAVLLNWPLGSVEAIVLVVLVLILLFFYHRALQHARQTGPPRNRLT